MPTRGSAPAPTWLSATPGSPKAPSTSMLPGCFCGTCEQAQTRRSPPRLRHHPPSEQTLPARAAACADRPLRRAGAPLPVHVRDRALPARMVGVSRRLRPRAERSGRAQPVHTIAAAAALLRSSPHRGRATFRARGRATESGRPNGSARVANDTRRRRSSWFLHPAACTLRGWTTVRSGAPPSWESSA